MRRVGPLVLLCATVACAELSMPVAPSARSAADLTTTLDLGLPSGASESVALDVNASGEVAGYATVAGVRQALRWDGASGFELLSGIVGPSEMQAIDDGGAAVGSGRVGTFTRAIRWRTDGGLDTLPSASGNPLDVANDINASGLIVGSARYLVATGPSVYQVHATTWQGATVARILVPGAVNSQAVAVNATGEVAGVFIDGAAQTRAFVASAGVVTVIVPPSGYSSSVATGINDAGVVVGYIRNASSTDTRAFTWTAGGGVTVLPLAGTLPYAIAYDVDATGAVVGAIRDDAGAFHAALFRDGTWTDLAVGDASNSVAYGVGANVVVGTRSAPIMTAHRWTVEETQPNTAPAVTGIQLPPLPASVGSVVTITASFTDADVGDTHVATVDWGFGPEVAQVSGNVITATRSFSAAGLYTPRVTVTDAAGASAERTSTLDSPSYLVVFNPSEGRVTGGGWLPVGDAACPSACGGSSRANFGFVVRYAKNSSVPTGNLEFSVHGGGLRFRATDLEWLVLDDAIARFAGTGTMDGVAGYHVLIAAREASGSTVAGLRVRITDPSGTVVFDTNPDASELDDSVTALGGGSVQLHR